MIHLFCSQQVGPPKNLIKFKKLHLGTDIWGHFNIKILPVTYRSPGTPQYLTLINLVTEQVLLLVGRAARPNFLKRLTWLAINHHPDIKEIDTVSAFHFGNQFLVEVHIVLPELMTVKDAHDIQVKTTQQVLVNAFFTPVFNSVKFCLCISLHTF